MTDTGNAPKYPYLIYQRGLERIEIDFHPDSHIVRIFYWHGHIETSMTFKTDSQTTWEEIKSRPESYLMRFILS